MSRFVILLVLSLITLTGFGQRKHRKSQMPPDTTVVLKPEIKQEIEEHNVFITVREYFPYCGGVYPDESDLNNYVLKRGTPFILIDLQTQERKQITCNDEGTLQLTLNTGTYAIRELFKECTLAEFRGQFQKKVSGPDYQDRGDDCYEIWWKSNLLEFTVESLTEQLRLDCIMMNQCFTANNPCLEYTGPYPP